MDSQLRVKVRLRVGHRSRSCLLRCLSPLLTPCLFILFIYFQILSIPQRDHYRGGSTFVHEIHIRNSANNRIYTQYGNTQIYISRQNLQWLHTGNNFYKQTTARARKKIYNQQSDMRPHQTAPSTSSVNSSIVGWATMNSSKQFQSLTASGKNEKRNTLLVEWNSSKVNLCLCRISLEELYVTNDVGLSLKLLCNNKYKSFNLCTLALLDKVARPASRRSSVGELLCL